MTNAWIRKMELAAMESKTFRDAPEARYSQNNWKRNNDKSLLKEERTRIHRLTPPHDA